MSKQIRYIRDYLNGNSRETPGSTGRTGGAGDGGPTAVGFKGCQWVQIAAWVEGRANSHINEVVSNAAFQGTVSANFAAANLLRITDGNTSAASFVNATATTEPLWVQVDLGAACDIESIQVWHRYDDGRIYFGHALQVSLDGQSWTTIVGGEGSVVEKSGGATYYLFKAVDSTNKFDDAFIARIKAAINESRAKRGQAAYGFTAAVNEFTTKIQPVQLTDLKNGLASQIRTAPASPLASDLSWTQTAPANSRAEAQDFNEVLVNYSRHLNSATCGSGCVQECVATCASTCSQSTCSYLCGSSCLGTCATNCSNACATGCFAACMIKCGATACAMGCGGSCSINSCRPNCSGSCEMGCRSECQSGWIFNTRCNAGCNIDCSQACQGYCGNICADGCTSACAGGCTDSCHKNCGATCTTSCGALCTVDCGAGCLMTCGAGCRNACGVTCQALCSSTCANGCEAASSGMDYNATTT